MSTALSDHPDCMSYLYDGKTAVKLIAAARQDGFTGKFTALVGSLTPSFLATLGSAGNGVIAVSTTLTPDSNDPLVKEFVSQVTAYTGASQAGATLNEFGQDGWSSVQLIKQALTGASEYTSAELLKKLPTMCDVNVGNVYPDVDFCKPAVGSTVYTRVFNPYVRYYIAENGKYVPYDDQWHDGSSVMS